MNTKIDVKIKNMCNNLNFPEGKMSDEYLFTIHAVDIFYFSGNIGQIDIKDRFTDGANDGGIDFVYTEDNTLYLIQGKSGNNLSIEEIENLFNKMKLTVSDFDSKNYSKYSTQLKQAYLNAVDSLASDYNIELVLFSDSIVDDEKRKKLQEYADSNLADFSISVYDYEDIANKSAESEYSAMVPEGKLSLHLNDDKNTNRLAYGDNGCVVNITAWSLKELYTRTYDKLFSYNLREHIRQKNVDDAIDFTIKNEKDKFWYYNNGITICCGDYQIDGNVLRLWDFSIINGAQTTTKIGESKFIDEKNNNFILVCKIVKTDMGDKNSEFTNKISEATNSQKPIQFRDLKSNAGEQKRLQKECSNNGSHSLSVEIKRGVTPVNYRKVEKWQRVTNEYLGQLIYACIFQKPGEARTDKRSIFSVPKIYNQIFKRKMDCDTLYDLVRIANSYSEFCERSAKKTDDTAFIGIANNAKFIIPALIVYLLKKQRGLISNASSSGVNADNINGLLISDYDGDDIEEKLSGLFEFLIRHLKRLYGEKESVLKLTSYSNFFKTNQNYEIILRSIDELDAYDQEKIHSYMCVFTKKRN